MSEGTTAGIHGRVRHPIRGRLSLGRGCSADPCGARDYDARLARKIHPGWNGDRNPLGRPTPVSLLDKRWREQQHPPFGALFPKGFSVASSQRHPADHPVHGQRIHCSGRVVGEMLLSHRAARMLSSRALPWLQHSTATGRGIAMTRLREPLLSPMCFPPEPLSSLLQSSPEICSRILILSFPADRNPLSPTPAVPHFHKRKPITSDVVLALANNLFPGSLLQQCYRKSRDLAGRAENPVLLSSALQRCRCTPATETRLSVRIARRVGVLRCRKRRCSTLVDPWERLAVARDECGAEVGSDHRPASLVRRAAANWALRSTSAH